MEHPVPKRNAATPDLQTIARNTFSANGTIDHRATVTLQNKKETLKNLNFSFPTTQS